MDSVTWWMQFREQFGDRLRTEYDREVDTVLVIDDLHGMARAVVPELSATRTTQQLDYQRPPSVLDRDASGEASRFYDRWREARQQQSRNGRG